ncbi:Transport and Golgi organization like [Actinidia chinensis var. chinensis]|uniref:Transport and Golgi organization like n=1 Tax=Actinidia chinensis var. chinensis TaxID=1590841 RepID=A0A2R6RMC3_ACTCC|nr:Transport and Golgi organization like [Actinidia chinensis var. chinensis]
MCIAVFTWQAHPFYPFLLFLNRDEYHNRPTKPVAWWEGGEILGGRDEVAGGTWLACTRGGKVAILTNVLELRTLPEAKSRGELPVRFLESKKSPKEFAEEVVKEAHLYNGFNLIMADLSSNTMVYISNMPKGEPIVIQDVPPGTHVLSNAKLDSPWPKAQRLVLRFGEMLDEYAASEIPVNKKVGKLMRDTVRADESKLPSICSPDWELSLSSIFVEADTPLGRYGTRSTAALTVSVGGEVSFHEINLESGEWRKQTIKYQIEKPNEMRDKMP